MARLIVIYTSVPPHASIPCTETPTLQYMSLDTAYKGRYFTWRISLVNAGCACGLAHWPRQYNMHRQEAHNDVWDIMSAYYLERYQWLAMPSSESAPRRGPPKGRLHILHGAVIADTWAARRDAKPETAQVEVLHTVQWPAGKRTMVEVKIQFVLNLPWRHRVIVVPDRAAFIMLTECTNGSNDASSIFRAEVLRVKIQFDLCGSHIFCSQLLCPLSPTHLSDHSPCSVSVYNTDVLYPFVLNFKMEAEYSFEAFMCCDKNTQRHNPQYRNINRTAMQTWNLKQLIMLLRGQQFLR
jgi:hypothetical protein